MYLDSKFWVCADYAHLRVPKRLLRDLPYKLLSPEAKLVYAAMLDRTSLSHKNRKKYTNSKLELFIYFPQTEIMDLLGCGHDKASKVLGELAGMGLINMRRHGIGRPYEIVLNPIDWRTQRKIKNEQSDKPLTNSERSDYSSSGKADINNTELYNSENIDPEVYLRRFFKCAVEYEDLICKFDLAVVDRILDVAVHTLAQDSDDYLIGDTYIPGEMLRESLRDITQDHFIYVLKQIQHATYTKNHSDAFILHALHESIAKIPNKGEPI